MNKKYDDDFFDELDKTTDLLKAFKPHIDTDKTVDLEALYSEINKNKKKNVSQKKSINNENKKNYSTSTQSDSILEKTNYTKVSDDDIKLQKKSKVFSLKNQSSKKNTEVKAKKKQSKTNINEIIDKMHTSVEEDKKKRANKKSDIKKVETKKKKNKIKFNGFELAFCAFSFLFIIGCIAIYGSRLFKYYRVYNPKSEGGQSLMLVTTAIGKNSSIVYDGDGLYMNGGDYTYKGSDVDNYLVFSNLTWRIIKTNSDGTIDLVLNDYINTLSWANRPKAYIESDIHKYLNNYFVKYLDKSYLAPTTICKDEVNDLKQFSCNNKNEDNYVRLPSVSDFLNSKTDSTYMASDTDTLWLNTISSDKTWQINGNNLSLADPTRALGIKPVIRLKSGVALISGDGSESNPYRVENEDDSIKIGDYVVLGTDKYIVYDTDDETLSLVLDGNLKKTYHFDLNSNIFNPQVNTSLAYYLNNAFLNSLSYKDLIVESEWNIGSYVNTYEDITSNKVRAKIGLYDFMNLKFDNEVQDYFLLNGISNGVYLYSNETIITKPAIYKGIRPAFRINKKNAISGSGTKDNPFILGE